MKMRILFVCMGNICRSPSAEAVFRFMAGDRPIEVDSAGTEDFHTGDPPSARAVEEGAKRGYDLTPLRARQIVRDDFGRFDLIVVMDEENRAHVEALRPLGDETPVRLFMEFVPDPPMRQVPDPYYSGDYEGALDLIEMASHHLLRRLDRLSDG